MIFEIERRRPKIIIIEPPCTWFSSLLHANWSKMPHQFRMAGMKASLRLYEFSLRIMELQLRAGRAFVLEHPARATSWQNPRTQCLSKDYPAVSFADFDFCMFGMVSKIQCTPIKKATRLMTNCCQVKECFNHVRCDGSHDHVICHGHEGGQSRSSYAQIYPEPFCSSLAMCIANFVNGIHHQTP